MLNFALTIAVGEFLLIIIEAGGKPMFGVIVHFVGANLKFDNFLFGGNDGGVEGLVAVLFGHSDVVLDAATHWGVERVDDTEDEVAIGNIVNNNAESGEVVDGVNVLVALHEFFVERIDGFDATIHFKFNFFFFEMGADFLFDFMESFFSGLVAFFDEILEVEVAFGVDIRERDISHLDAKAPHVEAVGERGENFKRFFGDFLLFVRREGGESAEIVKAVGKFDNEDADVVASGDK